MSKSKMPMPTRGSKIVLSVGLVNVPVKFGLFSQSTSVAGKRVCAKHAVPVTAGTSVCSHDGHEIDKDDVVTGFEHEGRYVLGVDRSEHRGERDGVMKLKHSIEIAELDPALYEKTYIVWPQDGGEEAHDLIAEAMRRTGTALVGTTTLSTSTKAVALRWSELTGTLLAHVLTYDEAIRWSDAKLVKEANETRKPLEEQVEMAEKLLATLSSDFELGDVEDEYRANLEAAIEAAAKGLPAPVVEETPEMAPVGDLMAALTASVESASPRKRTPQKPKPRRNGAPKKPARRVKSK